MPIEQAASWTIQEWQQIANQYPGTRVEIGECNWPTGIAALFWGAPGTNQTVFTVTNSGLPSVFFRTAQAF
jgi:hypothetical protein